MASGLDSGDGQPPSFEDIATNFVAGWSKTAGTAAVQWVVEPVLHLAAALVALVFAILDPIALLLIQAFLDAFDRAAAGPLNTLLNVVGAELAAAVKGQGGKLPGGDGGLVIANAFLDRITAITPHDDGAGPEPSLDPAKQFLGMMATVSLRGWVMDVLAQVTTVGQIEAFEDLIALIVRSFGFGRLARVVMTPMLNATLGAATQSRVNLDYRPKLLVEGAAARAVLRGNKDPGWFAEELGRQGYAGDRINELLADAQKFMSLELADRLVRAGELSQAGFNYDAQAQGYSETDAGLIQRAFHLQREDAQSTKIIDAALVAVHDGIMSAADFDGLLQTLNVPEDERQTWNQIVEIRLTIPRKQIGLSELNQLFQKNLMGSGDYRTYLTQLGYSEGDQVWLELLQTQIVHDKEAAQAAKKALQDERKAQKEADKQARDDAAAQRKADLLKRRQDAQDFMMTKQKAAGEAAIARIQATQDAIVQRHQLIDQAQKDKLLTQAQADTARAQLATLTAQHNAQTAAHSQQMAALDAEQTAIETNALDQTAKAAAVAQEAAAAKSKASLDQQILDAKRADRQAGYALARQSAQDAFTAGEITAKDLAKKLRAISLQESKDQKAEDVAQLQIERGSAAAEATAAKGTIAVEAIKGKAAIAPAATTRRNNAIAATLADHLQTAADVGTTRVQQLADLTTKKIAAADAAAAQRDALDQQLAAQRVQLEEQIQANKPPPPPVE